VPVVPGHALLSEHLPQRGRTVQAGDAHLAARAGAHEQVSINGIIPSPQSSCSQSHNWRALHAKEQALPGECGACMQGCNVSAHHALVSACIAVVFSVPTWQRVLGRVSKSAPCFKSCAARLLWCMSSCNQGTLLRAHTCATAVSLSYVCPMSLDSCPCRS
jgi:hypothetical protein